MGAGDQLGQAAALAGRGRVIRSSADHQGRRLDLSQAAGEVEAAVGADQCPAEVFGRGPHLCLDPAADRLRGAGSEPGIEMAVESAGETHWAGIGGDSLGDQPVFRIGGDGRHQHQSGRPFRSFQAEMLSHHAAHGMTHDDGPLQPQ